MFRPGFGAVGRILSRRFFNQAAAAGSPSSRSAGVRLVNLNSQRNVGDAAATAARHSGFFRRKFPGRLLGGTLTTSALCVGLGFWRVEIEELAERITRPSKIDWVKAGVVSPIVRNQKDCGCCWAMAAAASVEAAHYLKTLQAISLSVQELIDCSTTNNGCEGGNDEDALTYIQKNGISSESSYPYMAQRSISGCKSDKIAAARISDFQFVDLNEDDLERAVAKQPVVVTLQNTPSLGNYKGGIMMYEAWPSTLPDGTIPKGHAVLIVGYGTDPHGIKYWRFKNSWGEGWGEGGFGRIRRHVADERGVLGMFLYRGVYPVLNI